MVMGISWVIIATVLAAAGGVVGVMALRSEKVGWAALFCMALSFGAQLMALVSRGELRVQCPLGYLAAIRPFMAWSLTLSELVTRTTSQATLLGSFTSLTAVL